MDEKIHEIFNSIVWYAEVECENWMRRVPKTHKNVELISAAKMTRKIKKAKQWLEENNPWKN